MVKEKTILKLEKRLLLVKQKLEYLQTREISPSYLNTLRIRAFELNNEINRLCAINLELTNNKFKEIAQDSYESLNVIDLKFKTYQEGMSYFGSYTQVLQGKLNKNGHVYCSSKTTNNWLLYPFAQYSYPSEFKGKIDCLGNVRLNATKLDSAWVNRLPSEFDGSISDNGEIKLITTKTEGDFLTRGKLLISKIIGQYTFNTPEKAARFYNNRLILVSSIEAYRMQIGTIKPSLLESIINKYF